MVTPRWAPNPFGRTTVQQPPTRQPSAMPPFVGARDETQAERMGLRGIDYEASIFYNGEKKFNFSITPDFEFVGTTPKLRGDDYLVHYAGKQVGTVNADTGELEIDNVQELLGLWYKENLSVKKYSPASMPEKISPSIPISLKNPGFCMKTTLHPA